MEVDENQMDIEEDRKLPASKPPTIPRLSESETIICAAKKQQMKVEVLVKKVLGVALSTSSLCDGSVVCIDVDAMEISHESIAEILAARLSISADYKTIPPQKDGVIPYLAHCYKIAAEEYKTIKDVKLSLLLHEIITQVISYAASSLFEPDLFELGHDGTTQLAKCL